jgi:hypothetical protein
MACACVASAANVPEPVRLLLYTPLDVDGGTTTATTNLQIYNPNSTPTECRFTITDAIAKNTGKPADWGITFYGSDGKPSSLTLQQTLPARSTLPIRVELTHVIDAGETDAALLCNGDKVSDLKLAKERNLPFRVTLYGNPAEKPAIDFVDGSVMSLQLKNDDPMEYPVDVNVIIKGISVASETKDIKAGPNGLTWFTVKPDKDWFSPYQSFFRSEQVDGIVTMGYKPPGATVEFPSKIIPITARLDYFHPESRAIWSTLLILAVLALGGGTSAYLKVNLVNRVKAISIGKRLGQLSRVIGEIGPQLNSPLRVSLWLERGRIESTLPRTALFTADTAAILAQSDFDTTTLQARVDWASKISDASVRLDHSIDAHDIAPSLADQINRDLRAAQDLLKKSVLGADELQKIQSLVGHAVNLLNEAGTPDDDLEKAIAARLVGLTARFMGPFLAVPACIQLKSDLPIPFGLLNPAIAPLGSQFDRDLNTRKLQVIADMVLMGRTDAPIVQCLQRQDFVSLPLAEQLLMELKESISLDNLKAELRATPPRVNIAVDRDAVRSNTPIMMKLMFNNSRYNRAAARQRIVPTWNFDDGLTEKGWEIHHYFMNPQTYHVSLTFKDMDQQDITPGTPVVNEVTVTSPRTDGQGYFAVEVQRWAVGFLVGILGLFAGAKDKILSLDTIVAIIALFLLGFGIDVAKNLLVSNDPPKPGS